MIHERTSPGLPGIPVLLLLLLLLPLSVVLVPVSAGAGSVVGVLLGVLLLLATLVALRGLFRVAPNEAKVLQLFGRYVQTVREPGLRFTNPFYSRKAVSVRVRNFETSRIKVNDARGNPIELAVVVVWRVVDTAEAIFEVDDFVDYVHVQSESALRSLVATYPYDAFDSDEVSLVGNMVDVSEKLRQETQARLGKAGIEVMEARISHLAYAPEIAQAMLRRQQAGAVIAARTAIVEGAVGMVQHALSELAAQRIVELDDERRAAMVSNLLVVLCSETETHPVINTGTLYT